MEQGLSFVPEPSTAQPPQSSFCMISSGSALVMRLAHMHAERLTFLTKAQAAFMGPGPSLVGSSPLCMHGRLVWAWRLVW